MSVAHRQHRLPPSALAIFLCGLCGAACSGQKGTLDVTIKVPPGDDPFVMARKVRMTVGDKTQDSDVMVQMNQAHFDISLGIDSPAMDQSVRLTVEALDEGGKVVGRGRSPLFVLTTNNAQLTIYVGRPGQVTPTDVKLLDDSMQPAGRTQLSGAALRGQQTQPPQRSFGALIVGGADSGGTSLRSAWIYDPLAHKLVTMGNTLKARRGAVLTPSADADHGQQALLFGGAVSQAGKDTEWPTTAEFFDAALPVTGTFASPSMEVADAGPPGAVSPAVAEVQANVFLVSGGGDKDMNPLGQAVLVRRFPAPAESMDKSARLGVRRIQPMAAPRLGHSATQVADGSVLLFGGLAKGDTRPVAELYVLDKDFKGMPLTYMDMGMPAPLPSRQGHVAVTLRRNNNMTGKVLIAGGALSDDPTQVLDSALLIDWQSSQVEVLSKFLATARQGASLSVVGDEIVICGGLGQAGKALDTCEIFSAADASQVPGRGPVTMPNPRAGHLALLLETDQLLLVGGTGAGPAPLPAIDIFTSAK